jgi:hypothetical protein
MSNRRISRLGAFILVLAGFVAMSMGQPRAQAEPTPAPDNSLTLKEYIDAGVPAIDKPWTAGDYQKAGTTLADIAKKDPTKLPRLDSKNSGDLFAHIIAQKNLAGLTDKTVPVDTRIKMAETITAYVPIFAAYADAIKPNQTLDAETLKLGGFILRAELAAGQVVEEFIAAHPDAKDNAGFKQARDGFAMTAGGVVEFMMDKDHIRKSEATRFAGELKGVLPDIVALFNADAQVIIKNQLKDAAAKEEDKDLKAALTDLLASLK